MMIMLYVLMFASFDFAFCWILLFLSRGTLQFSHGLLLYRTLRSIGRNRPLHLVSTSVR